MSGCFSAEKQLSGAFIIQLLTVAVFLLILYRDDRWFTTFGKVLIKDSDLECGNPMLHMICALMALLLIMADHVTGRLAMILTVILFTGVQSLFLCIFAAQGYLYWNEFVVFYGILSACVAFAFSICWDYFVGLGNHSKFLFTDSQFTMLALILIVTLCALSFFANLALKCLAILAGFSSFVVTRLVFKPLEGSDSLTNFAQTYLRLASLVVRFLAYLCPEECEEIVVPDPIGQMQEDPPLGLETSDSILPGLELHRKVPPDSWCVTRADVEQFVADVRVAWLRGEIPPAADHESPHHNDPHIGPSMYQVNKHFIKPRTLASGGMSYALMLHPEGLPVDIFMTHAWAEGVFEFADKLLDNWPADVCNLWCCFLANPQNGDISELLGGDVLCSPFALAIKRAKKMIAIPNCAVSIYKRMWCVLEAKLGIEYELDISIPTSASPKLMRRAEVHGYYHFIVLASCGFVWVWLIQCRAFFLGGFVSVNCWYAFFVLGAGGTEWAKGSSIHSIHKCRMGIIGVAAGALVRLRLYAALEDPRAWLLLSFVPLCSRYMLKQLKDTILKSEATQLEFTTVLDADCTCAFDKTRIMEAIAGQESHIDDMIRRLQSVGIYDTRVRRELELDFEPVKSHHVTLSQCLVTILVWGVCLMGSPVSFFQPSVLFYYETLFAQVVRHMPYPAPVVRRVFVTMSKPLFAMSLSATFFIGVTVTNMIMKPHMLQATFSITVLWISGWYCLGCFGVFETVTKVASCLGWSRNFPEALDRLRIYFRVWCLFASIAVAITYVVLGPRSLPAWAPTKTAILASPVLISMVLLIGSLYLAGPAFESCTAACFSTQQYENCVSACAAHYARLPFVWFALGLCSAAVVRISKARHHNGVQVSEIPQASLLEVELTEMHRSHNQQIAKKDSFHETEARSHGHALAVTIHKACIVWGLIILSLFVVVFIGSACPFPSRSVPLNQHNTDKFQHAWLSNDASMILFAVGGLGKIHSTATGRLVQRLEGHTSSIVHASFTGDDKIVATSASDVVKIWNIHTGLLLHSHVSQHKKILSWSMNSDASFVAMVSIPSFAILEPVLEMWDVKANLTTWMWAYNTTHAPIAVAISADSKLAIVSILGSKAKEVLDAKTGKVLRRWYNGTSDCLWISTSRDGARLFTSSHAKLGTFYMFSGELGVVDMRTGSQVRRFKMSTRGHIMSAAGSADGSLVLLGLKNGWAELRSVDNGTTLFTFDARRIKTPGFVTNPVVSVSISADNSWCMMASEDGAATIWDVRKKRVHRVFEMTSQLRDIQFLDLNNDASKLLVGTASGISVQDAVSGTTYQQFRASVGSMSRDGTKIAVVDGGRELKFADVNKKALDAVEYTALWKPVMYSAALRSDEIRVVLSSTGSKVVIVPNIQLNTVQLWDVQQRTKLWQFDVEMYGLRDKWGVVTNFSARLSKAAFSSDESIVAVGTWYRGHRTLVAMATLLDTKHGKVLQTLGNHTAVIRALAVNGCVALTAAFDGTAKLWDVTSGALLQTFTETPWKSSRMWSCDSNNFWMGLSVSLSEDSSLALLSYGATCALVTTRRGILLRTYSLETGSFLSTQFSKSGWEVYGGVRDDQVSYEVGEEESHISRYHHVGVMSAKAFAWNLWSGTPRRVLDRADRYSWLAHPQSLLET